MPVGLAKSKHKVWELKKALLLEKPLIMILATSFLMPPPREAILSMCRRNPWKGIPTNFFFLQVL